MVHVRRNAIRVKHATSPMGVLTNMCEEVQKGVIGCTKSVKCISFLSRNDVNLDKNKVALVHQKS